MPTINELKYLSTEDLKHISRATIIHTNDFIIQNITRNMGQRGGVAYNIDCQFGNIIIPFAIILESRFEG